MKAILIIACVFFIIFLNSQVLCQENDEFSDDPSLDGYDSPDGYGDSGPDPYGDPAAPTVKQLNSIDEIDGFVKSDDFEPAVIGFFDASSGEDEIKVFKELAGFEVNNYRFAYTTDKETLESKKYDRCAVVVYPPSKFVNEKFERAKYRFPGKSIVNSVSFLDFVRQKSVPLVGEVTTSSKPRYGNLKTPEVTVFIAVDHKRNSKGFQYVANRLRKIAKEYSGKLVFNIANIHDYVSLLESAYSVEDVNVKNTYAGLREGKVFYTLTGDFSFDKLGTFVQDFKAGKLVGKEQQVQDETEPSPEEEHGDVSYENTDVVQVNNGNFDAVVEETSSDVLLEFYAPWCGHCKHLSPEYKKLASHFKSDKGITIAAMDANAGNVPSKYDVQGYPTIVFIPGDSKQPVSYDDERDVNAMIKYIETHRTTSSNKEDL